MRVVFWGTPDFSLPPLKSIYNSDHEVVAVVTIPDKKQGRGLKEVSSPVKQWAVENKIPVLQPELLQDPDFIQQLQEIKADIFVVVAFKILPPVVFTIPEFGSFNLHASLLPKFRGAAPIQWALIKGETETGVTTFKLEQKVDTGNLYIQQSIAIEPEDNFGSLHDKLSVLGSSVVVQTLDLVTSGNYVLLPQDNNAATPAPKIIKETCLIDWNKPVGDVRNLIRGLSPYPGAFFSYKNEVYKVFSADIAQEINLASAEIKTSKNEIFIGCANGSLKILELQKEGRKRMTAEEFLRGYTF
ncbi:MAG: methionyl-tRNA formyltransferase [Ignavibacteriales bacterium]|nr:methionyl-tRNA formyltransferase [Ignavibacteriales bacterium]